MWPKCPPVRKVCVAFLLCCFATDHVLCNEDKLLFPCQGKFEKSFNCSSTIHTINKNITENNKEKNEWKHVLTWPSAVTMGDKWPMHTLVLCCSTLSNISQKGDPSFNRSAVCGVYFSTISRSSKISSFSNTESFSHFFKSCSNTGRSFITISYKRVM